MIKKKASGNSVLVALIIGLIILLSLLTLGKGMFDTYNDKKQKITCKKAIEMNSALKLEGDDFFSLLTGKQNEDPSDVPCPTFYETINEDNEEDTKKKLALMMYDSWDMMHEGKLELFNGETGKETYCILTHLIKFQDKNSDIVGFENYLKDNDVPNPTIDKKYFEYLKCFNPTPELFEGAGNPSDGVIETSLDYGIMFVYAKEGHLQKVWSAFKGSKLGFAGGVVAGTVLALFPEPTGFTKGMAIVVFSSVVGTTAGAGTGYLAGNEKSADWQACVMLLPITEKTLKELDCTYMPGIQGNKESE